MDISIIPTIQRSKKPAKPRYIKPDSVKRLEADYYEWKYRNSTIPTQCRVKPHEGRVYNFEIKIGRDRQSDVQKAVETRIKKAGGHYAVIKCYDDFLKEIIHNGEDRSYQPAG